MKLAQRFVLAYYRSKFKAVSIVSKQRAAGAAFALFCTPFTRNKKDRPAAIFDEAETLSLQVDGVKVTGFKWKPVERTSRSILICHGFESNSFRFHDYITALVNRGFDVIAFDAPAHGVSNGKRITIVQYIKMIRLIDEAHGPLYGIMAHSLGGLAAVLALEQLPEIKCNRLVLIAPSTETTHAVEKFLYYLKIKGELKNKFYQVIEGIGGHPLAWFSVARAIQNINIPTLWIHDKKDTITPFEHMKHLAINPPRHITFQLTEGLGHSPYRYPEVQENILSFLTA